MQTKSQADSSTLFEAIKRANTPSEEALMAAVAVLGLRDQHEALKLTFQTQPQVTEFLERMEDNLNAIQWFIEGTQDAREIADQLGGAK